jgi:hypothetical protein
MESILRLHHFHHPEQTKLLFESVQSFIYLEWIIRFLEDRRLRIQKILEITILIWFWSLTDIANIMVSHVAECVNQSTLALNKRGQELRRSGWR